MPAEAFEPNRGIEAFDVGIVGWLAWAAQSLDKSSRPRTPGRSVVAEEADSRQLRRLLRVRRKRPGCRCEPVSRALSLPRGTRKSLASCRGNLNHSESF